MDLILKTRTVADGEEVSIFPLICCGFEIQRGALLLVDTYVCVYECWHMCTHAWHVCACVCGMTAGPLASRLSHPSLGGLQGLQIAPALLGDGRKRKQPSIYLYQVKMIKLTCQALKTGLDETGSQD